MKEISERNKVLLLKKVQKELKKKGEKKKFYSQKEVQNACEAQQIPIDWACWAYCVFTDLPTFNNYHESIGESCDYNAMRSSVVEAVDNSDLEITHLAGEIGESSFYDFFDGLFDFDFDIDIDFF